MIQILAFTVVVAVLVPMRRRMGDLEKQLDLLREVLLERDQARSARRLARRGGLQPLLRFVGFP